MAQEDPQLVSYIRDNHLRSPQLLTAGQATYEPLPVPEIAELFKWKVIFLFYKIVLLAKRVIDDIT